MQRSIFSLVVATLLAASAASVEAEDPLPAEDFQRTIEEQQRQLEAQQKQLDEQRQLLDEFQKRIDALSKDSDAGEAVADSDRPKDASTGTEVDESSPAEAQAIDRAAAFLGPQDAGYQERAPLSDADKHDQESPTASNVSYLRPAAKVMIPGIETEIRVHGLIELQIFHDTVGINNNRFDTATIPVDGGPSQTKFSVNPTQLAVSSVTPVNKGHLNTWFSMDMNGQLDRPEPRLRIAIGEYVNDAHGYAVLGGQTYSTTMDLRAVPETLDFATPAGTWQLRHPLLRFTKAFGTRFSAEVSAESPESVVYTDADRLTRLPDFGVAGTWFAGGDYLKHVRLTGLVRDLRAEGTNGISDSAIGWVVGASTKIGLPFLDDRDNLRFTVHYGDGYGTTVKGGPVEGVFDNINSRLDATGIFGFYGGIQHFWSDRFRSNLIYGQVDATSADFAAPDTYENTRYAAANFIWSPHRNVTLGVEYLWGWRENKNGASGRSDRILFSSKITF